MIGLLQRVSEASVSVNGETVGQIGPGLLALVGFERGDRQDKLDRFVQRLLAFRLFPDAEGRMNLCLRETRGGLLLVPQFTLAADTDSGNRPSFTPAAPPEEGERLFHALLDQARREWPDTAAGVFGASMQVALVNDGPVTFRLRVAPD